MKVKSLERVGNKIRIIDQTRLPSEVVYRDLNEYQSVIAAIQQMQVRGAPAIGIAAAYALALAAEKSPTISFDELRQIGGEIMGARPTAVNLSWAVRRMLFSLKGAQESEVDQLREALWSEAEAIHEEDRLMCENIGQAGAGLIDSGDSILTHCNTGALATGGMGTALGVIYTCRDQGKKIRVFSGESRPLLQGSRLTAWELLREEIDVTLVCDAAAGMLMKQKKINKVIVGADRIAANGDTANKIGTYSLAVLAREHDIPFYVAAPSSTFDSEIESGDQIVIEERSADEITRPFETQTAPDGVSVYAPAFDITPGSLVTAFITDKGVEPGGRQA